MVTPSAVAAVVEDDNTFGGDDSADLESSSGVGDIGRGAASARGPGTGGGP